jgi:hypothetical protein
MKISVSRNILFSVVLIFSVFGCGKQMPYSEAPDPSSVNSPGPTSNPSEPAVSVRTYQGAGSVH